MRARFTLVSGLAIVLAGGMLLAWAQESAGEKKVPAPRASKNAAFERMKQLAGEWYNSEAKEGDKNAGPSVIYRVVSNGSVVMEDMFPGTDHNMITMYYVDGDDLVLVHYCAIGNQPRMKAERSEDSRKIDFKFAGGSNVDPDKDIHMHELTLTFVDADHITAEWRKSEEGKVGPGATFKLERRKARAG